MLSKDQDNILTNINICSSLEEIEAGKNYSHTDSDHTLTKSTVKDPHD